MKFRTFFQSLLPAVLAPALLAQVASHTPSKISVPKDDRATMELVKVQGSDKPILRINGNVLTDRDLVHEMYAIFPYAQQHAGFPKSLEKEIRQGAKQMLIFEELVYQEAEKRKITVPPAKINAGEASLRKELGAGPQGFDAYLKMECKGSRQVLRQKIRRSLMIEALLKSDVYDKAPPTEAQIRNLYDKNTKVFSHNDSVHIQTVSIMPPPTAGPEVNAEAQKKAEKAYAEAKKTKNYKEFGLVAEKYSDDDWHVKLGDRKFVELEKLPPPVVQAIAKLKDGEISPLVKLGNCFTFVRLVERKPAGKEPYATVRATIKEDLRKERTEQLRGQLNQKLQKGAKIEEL